MSEIEQLKAENAELIKKIAEMRLTLGVSQLEDDKAKARSKEMFDEFDADGNGYIDRQEFEVVAFNAGIDANLLTDAKIDETFKNANTSADGKLTFEQFYKWINSSAAQADGKSEKQAGVGLLRVKLQSRAWSKSLATFKQKAIDSNTADSKHAAAPDAKSTDKNDKQFNISCGMTDMTDEDAKASVILTIDASSERAVSLKEEVECPEEVTAFAHVDLKLQPDADDLQAGELIGMLELILEAVIPPDLPFLHSHTVDIHEDEGTGDRYLRLVFFSAIDPITMATDMMMMSMGGDDVRELLNSAMSGSVKFLLPFSLNEFIDDKQKTLDLDALKFLFQISFVANPEVQSRASEMLARMGPAGAKLRLQMAGMQFARNVDFTLEFSSVQEFYDSLKSVTAQLEASGQEVPRKISSTMTEVESLLSLPVGATVEQKLSGMTGAIPPEHHTLYSTIQSTLTGLSTIRIVMGDNMFTTKFTGLDPVAFLPQLPGSE
jgi:3-methyladenine DNA glycosylase Tag